MSAGDHVAYLGDGQDAHKVDLKDLSELLDGLVHEHCMVGDTCVVDQACQGLSIQLLFHLQREAPVLSMKSLCLN